MTYHRPPSFHLLSRAERYAAGKALRGAVPRESHGVWSLRRDRDAVAILAESDRTRIADLLPIRYERMCRSAFAFLRGAAAVMAHDLAQHPAAGIAVQACGDCHLMNFGTLLTPEGTPVFDINDFDETVPGVDFTLDIKRLAASVVVAALDAGLSRQEAERMARDTVSAYRRRVRHLAELPPIVAWQVRTDLKHELALIEDKALRRRLRALLPKNTLHPPADDNFPHLVASETDGWRIQDKPPLIYHFHEGRDGKHTVRANDLFLRYGATLPPERRILVERYGLVDIALKVVGVGSVGTFCAVGLFMTADDEPLLLQVKEAQAPVLAPLSNAVLPDQQGQRVVEGQRILQAASDVFLGWTEESRGGRQFYVRQLKNRRIASIGDVVERRALTVYAELCGRTLARAHLRAGDGAAMAGYMGGSERFDDAIASFAMAYADQTAYDYEQLVKERGTPQAK